MLIRSPVVVVCLALACASNKPAVETPVAQSAPTPEPAAVASQPPPPKPEIGSFGFDTAGMDTTAAPGESFFRYANGQWLDTTEIPADRAAYGMFTKLDELSRARTRTLIEDGAKADVDEGTDARKVGDLFAAFMDEAAIEAGGIT